jgi:hypothetical protein
MKRYSEMSHDEIQAEMQRLRSESMKKYQAGYLSEAGIMESKYFMARSYLLKPENFPADKEYIVSGYDEPFYVQYLRGVMAWGYFRSSDEQRAFPIGRLEEIKNTSCGCGGNGCN